MPLRNAPKPAGKEGNIHALRAHDTESSLIPGLADVWPANHMVLLLIIIASPIESRLDFDNLMVKSLVKAVEAHEEQEEAREGGVDEDRPGRLRKPPTLPGLYARLQDRKSVV